MSVFFSDDFDTGNFTAWTGHAIQAAVSRRGCDGTFALLCGGSPPIGQVWATGPSQTATGTVRVQMAYLTGGTGLANVFLQVFLTASLRQFELTANPNGSIQLTGGGGGGATSSAGLIPTDGTWHSWEFPFTITAIENPPSSGVLDNYLDLDLVMDGVTLFTFTAEFIGPNNHTPFGIPALWDTAYFTALSATSGPNYLRFAIDNVELDNAATILSPPVCDAVTLYQNVCSLAPIAEVDGMTVDCATNQITITGTNFLQDTQIDLQAPGGPAAFDLVSRTLTEIVLQLTDPLISGEHCVTVTN